MTSLTLVRRIKARPQVVFDAVTTAEGIARWWGPDAGRDPGFRNGRGGRSRGGGRRRERVGPCVAAVGRLKQAQRDGGVDQAIVSPRN